MIIGLTGKAGSGKSTAATYLYAYHAFQSVPFAGPLKGMLQALGVEDECLYGSRKEEPLSLLNGRSARHAMQTLGTEWGRDQMGDTFWVNLWAERVKEKRRESFVQNIVADDVRFLNEVKQIWDMGGRVIKIVRPTAEEIKTGAHRSEHAVMGCDYEVYNDGDKRGLYQQIASALVDIRAKSLPSKELALA
jgi:hypothetical protein